MSHNHYDKSRDSKPLNTEVKESKPEDIKKDSETLISTPEVQDAPVVPEVKEEKKEEPKVEPIRETPVVKNESKKEEKRETPKVSTPPIMKQSVAPKKVITIKAGMSCKLKPSIKETVNHHEIPDYAYRNAYKVMKVLNDRIIIKAGLTYTLAVKPEDVTLI